MDINPYDQFDDAEEDPYAQFDSFDNPVPERTLGSTLKDTGISLAKGVIGAGQGIVGLADIPTGGRVGRGLESIGIKPEEWQKDLSEEYSPAQQEANKKVDAAKGFADTAQAMLENPSTIAHGIVETLPSVAAGGVLGRGALALSSKILPKAVTALGKTGSTIAAGSVGEGAISAGQTAEQIRNATPNDLLTAEQSALAAASGLGTAAFGLVGGSLAKKLGFADIDTMIVSGLNPAKKEGFKGVVKSIIGGGITEGVFEELPQTVQETIFTNAALDKPLLDGVPEGAAQAIILGGVMGAGANLLPGVNKTAEKTEQELELDRRAANILNLKEDELGKSVQTLNENIKSNQELINDLDKLETKAREENVDPAELIRKTLEENKNNQSLLDRINSGIQKKEELAKKEYEALSPEEKEVKEIEDKLATHRYESASQLNERITNIDNEITTLSDQYNKKFDPYSLDAKTSPSAEERKVIEDKLIQLNKRRNELLDKELPEVKKAFAPYTTREDRQKYLEELFGTVNVGEKVGLEKDAAESAQIIASEIVPKSIADYANQIIANKSQEQSALNDQVSSRTPEEEHNLRQIEDYVNYVKAYINNSFTPEERKVIENYWQGVKKELNLRQEEMTPGTEAFMRKKFFETQLANIEGNVKSDTAAQSEAKQNVVPSLTEQNKRQVWFQQIAKDLGDVQIANRQAVEPEIPRNLPGGLPSGFTNERQVGSVTQFQATENQDALTKVNLEDIKKAFPNQTITQHENGSVFVQFKNGQGLTINSIQAAGQDLIKLAIETGQMSKDGKILGITIGNEILLDQNFADNKTLWHENKHVLDNLGLVTEADNSALNKEFNKLRKAGKLDFALSTHKDPKQRMVENRANMFAQIMVNRAEYRNTAFGKVIQRVMDFFQQMLSFGKQTVSGLAREVESGKLYDRQAEALREGMPMFEVREETVQKISDDVYQQMFSERNSLVRTIGQTLRMRGHEIKQLIDKGLGSISTRLKNVDPMLRSEIRNLDFRTAQKIVTALRIAHPLLEKTKQMSPQDKFVWDAARRNSDEVKIKEIAEKYNMTADQEKLRAVLDQIRQDAIDVGYDVGFIEEYWPRIIKDQEGFLQATKGISQRPVITDAIKVYADKLGMTVEKFEIEYPEQAADIEFQTFQLSYPVCLHKL